MKKTNLDNWICETEALPVLTREGLEALQLKKLNTLLARLHPRHPEYPRQLKQLEDLETLPFTTAAMLAEHPGQYLLTSQSEVSRVISGATSGTTGPAKRVFYTPRDTEHTIGLFVAGISEMLAPGQSCMICFPFTGPFGLGDLIAKAVERIGAAPIKAGFGQTWRELMELTRQTKPDTYIGFPVTLLSLIRLYGSDFPVQRALVSADACPDGVMQALEAALGSKLYPHYGSRECGLGGAVTCPAFAGMHLRENHIIPEIIDSQGNVLPHGEYGELVITTIGMEAMPLIRYRTGDYTRILPPCPCGGVSLRLDTVSRRDTLPVSMEALDSCLFRIPELVDYTAHFDGSLTLRVKTTRMGTGQAIRAAAAGLYPKLTVQVTETPASPADRPLYLGKRYVMEA